MKDPRNLTIATLCVSATILATVLVLMQLSGGSPVYADSPSVAGDYILITGAVSRTDDMLYIIDRTAMKMNAYYVDRSHRITLRDQADLRQLFRKR